LAGGKIRRGGELEAVGKLGVDFRAVDKVDEFVG